MNEAIRLFRANSLFRNFELQGGADRVLMYLTAGGNGTSEVNCYRLGGLLARGPKKATSTY